MDNRRIILVIYVPQLPTVAEYITILVKVRNTNELKV